MQYMAAVWTGNNIVKLEKKTLRELGDNEVLIRVRAAGICGTDLHLIEGNFPGCLPPVVPGHEFAGEIVKVGKSEDSTLIGERAGCDSYIGCGKCFYCLKDERHLCREGTCELGINVDGGWAEYVIAPADNVYILPKEVTYDEAGAGCILNCPMAAIEKMKVISGELVLIIGDGPSSLVMVQLAKLKGAGGIIVIGHRDKRLNLAKEFGADIVLNTQSNNISGFIDGLAERPDVVIDAVGSSESFNLALEIAGTGTRIHLFGLPDAPLDKVNMQHFLFKELVLTSSTGNPSYWPVAMGYLSAGLLKIKPIISHKFNFRDIIKALEFIDANPQEIIKTILTFE